MFAYEQLKIGAGPPPIRVDEGWLLIHHGVTGMADAKIGVARLDDTHSP